MLNTKINKNKGITLIALVITIIVLLILAAVSIAMLTGENGILTQAQNAKKETSIAEEKEQIALAYNAVKAEEKGGAVTADKLDKELEKDGADATQEGTNIKVTFRESRREYIIDENGNITEGTGTTPPAGDDNTATVGEIVQPGEGNKEYTSGEYTAIIPEGFMIVPGCEDISKGLVISDNPTDTEKDSSNITALGNQFVWIPVASEAEYIRNTSYASTNVSAKAYTDKEYLPDGIAPTIPADSELEIPEGKTKDEAIGLINEEAERDAVVGKGGFYISRYEAGNEGLDKLISKNGATVWVSKSQEEFKEIGKSFVDNNNVKSAMCSGIQWDMAMKFITENDEKYHVTTATSSWHTGSKVVASGQNKEDKACNIYDLESNSYEYVAEKNSYRTSTQFVYRGGSYRYSNPASYRYFSSGAASSGYSFRFVLYVM